MKINPHFGPDYTLNTVTPGTWIPFTGSARLPDYVQDWRNSAGATFEVTGVQMEVAQPGQTQPTPFEHLPYDIVLQRCQRYCQSFSGRIGIGNWSTGTSAIVTRYLNPPMRATPSIFSYTAGNCLVESVAWYSVGSVTIQIESTNNSVNFQLGSISNSGQSANANAVWGNGALVVIQSEL